MCSRDGPASLSNSSEDESSEYEAPMQRKTSTRAVGRPSKLAQIRAKLQRKNIKTTKSKIFFMFFELFTEL